MQAVESVLPLDLKKFNLLINTLKRETKMDATNEVTQAAAQASTAEMDHKIKANFDNKVDVKEFKFHFKKNKDKDTGLEVKRPSVELRLPVPSVEGLVAIMETGGKGLELLLDTVADVIAARARDFVNEREDIGQDNFPLDQLSWEVIANLPKAERRGGGISKEVWDDFAADYIEVMPTVTGKSEEKVGNAAKIFLGKFNAVKTNKPVLKLMKDQLALYAANTPNGETYAECIEFLMNKADNLINADESALLNNL